ncbi:sensor histidine kinase [Curvibacter lanceolatus]|nr:HAMP domain-containing sensor histidine kinase [Curvibacter lanceolatus]
MRDVLISKVMVPGESGALIGVLTVLTDVTEFREAERAIREARDVAEEASRSKSEFVANISHELRTPLQSIIGFSELGVMRGKGSDRIVAMFHDINASGQRMLALVNDLLDVSKIESTVGTFHLESVDLRSLIRPVAREMGPLLARKNLSLDMDLSDLPLVARADPLRFQQVIRNVLANAVKFSPNDQTVSLSAQIGDGSEIHIVVRDHGPGIPEAELEKIFEAFVQSSKTKNGSGGTGLGLAICRKIVEGHGGRIRACNVSDGGAEFHIYFPARSGSAESQPMPLT